MLLLRGINSALEGFKVQSPRDTRKSFTGAIFLEIYFSIAYTTQKLYNIKIMTSKPPLESFGEIADKFPGIVEGDPKVLGRFAFHAARHMPSEDVRYRETGERHEDWHDEVRDVVERVYDWVDHGHQDMTRAELASKISTERKKVQEMNQFLDLLQNSNSTDAMKLVTSYLKENNFRIKTSLDQSPLFPGGRTEYEEIENAIDPETGEIDIRYGSRLVGEDGQRCPTDIEEYISGGHSQRKTEEVLAGILNTVEKVNPAELESLRQAYGSKAANLISFNEKLEKLYEKSDNERAIIKVDIPPFIPVSVEMYETWLTDRDAFLGQCEAIRLQAIEMKDKGSYRKRSPFGMCVVRSSAVKSEDGDKHSGAGVYKSIAVKPEDKEAFIHAVEEVYRSTRDDAALSYQESVGVTNELMGLVVQQYQESVDRSYDAYFGHANSRGVNENLVEVHTNKGTLIYDKQAILDKLLVGSEDVESFLHTFPDHNSDIRNAIRRISDLPHGVVLAETIFQGPVQVEFASDSIVQVRPLFIAESEEVVHFPEDSEPRLECAALGVGDVELELLDERNNNSDKKGFVIFADEYGFTIHGYHAGYNSLPKEGAVIIMSPSSSGHIQAHCREKGLMCFYPNEKGKSNEMFRELEEFDACEVDISDKALRFVADGYQGKIYDL